MGRDQAFLVGTGKGALGGIRGHPTFSRFLGTAEPHGALGTRQKDPRALPWRVRFTDLVLAPESVFMTSPQVILRPIQVLRCPASSSEFSPLWKGPMPLRDVGGWGAGLSGCGITLRLDVPLPVPAWGTRPHRAPREPGGQLRPRQSRNLAWSVLLLLLAESQFQPKLSSDCLFPAPLQISTADPLGERLSVYLVWLESPSRGPFVLLRFHFQRKSA